MIVKRKPSIPAILVHQVVLISHHHQGQGEKWAKDDNLVSAGLADCDDAGGPQLNQGQAKHQESSIVIQLL